MLKIFRFLIKTMAFIFVSILIIMLFLQISYCKYQDIKIKLETISANQWNDIILNLRLLSKNNQDYKIIKDDTTYIKTNIISGRTKLTNNDLKLIKKLEDEDINFKSMDFSFQDNIYIFIGGCVDDKLFLMIKDLNNREKTQVSISWGEHPLKEKILW